MRVAGSRPQGPVGQVSRGLGARASRAWGPAHQGPGAFSQIRLRQPSNTPPKVGGLVQPLLKCSRGIFRVPDLLFIIRGLIHWRGGMDYGISSLAGSERPDFWHRSKSMSCFKVRSVVRNPKAPTTQESYTSPKPQLPLPKF